MQLLNRSADPALPFQKQISNRLAGTAIGELLGQVCNGHGAPPLGTSPLWSLPSLTVTPLTVTPQRFEHLESPDFHPALLGAAQVTYFLLTVTHDRYI